MDQVKRLGAELGWLENLVAAALKRLSGRYRPKGTSQEGADNRRIAEYLSACQVPYRVK